MDGRPTWTVCDEAGDYVVPNVLSPRDLVFRPDNMDETVPHTQKKHVSNANELSQPEPKSCPRNQNGKKLKQQIDKIQGEHMVNSGSSYFPKGGHSAMCTLTEPIKICTDIKKQYRN